MEWIQSILDSSTIPLLSALILGLLTAISPCPMATNIAAIGYIGKEVTNRRRVFFAGLAYTLGRVAAYSALGIVLIILIRSGVNLFGVQRAITSIGEWIIAPLLIVVGAYMLLGEKLKLPSLNISGEGERVAKRGGYWGAFLLGLLFALTFCPSSCIFYFGMLIPLSATTPEGYILPTVFAISTSLPVVIVAWVIAFSANKIGVIYNSMQVLQKRMNLAVGILFIAIGIYYCLTFYI